MRYKSILLSYIFFFYIFLFPNFIVPSLQRQWWLYVTQWIIYYIIYLRGYSSLKILQIRSILFSKRSSRYPKLWSIGLFEYSSKSTKKNQIFWLVIPLKNLPLFSTSSTHNFMKIPLHFLNYFLYSWKINKQKINKNINKHLN